VIPTTLRIFLSHLRLQPVEVALTTTERCGTWSNVLVVNLMWLFLKSENYERLRSKNSEYEVMNAACKSKSEADKCTAQRPVVYQRPEERCISNIKTNGSYTIGSINWLNRYCSGSPAKAMRATRQYGQPRSWYRGWYCRTNACFARPSSTQHCRPVHSNQSKSVEAVYRSPRKLLLAMWQRDGWAER
jgi:hypothetical protein